MIEVSGKGGISAKVVADSIANGIRLTTLELRYPRFIHSEFMTHRSFSRNAASSRAIPVLKMLEQVREDPAMPIHWGKNQPGMQATVEIDYYSRFLAEMEWAEAAFAAADAAEGLSVMLGTHKQVANRLLEPFQFMTTIVTATEWDNFFMLRLHADAQPEIHELAKTMRQAMDASVPEPLLPHLWHLPYVHTEDLDLEGFDWLTAIKCSVARCARVSYLNHDGSKPDIMKDLDLYHKLEAAGHMSPLEHVAAPLRYVHWFEDDAYEPNKWTTGVTHMDKDGNYWSGNLRGFISWRQLINFG